MNELLTKLSTLEARGADIIDNPKLADFALEKPENKITITLEEETKPLAKDKIAEKKTRAVTYFLGKKMPRPRKFMLQWMVFPE